MHSWYGNAATRTFGRAHRHRPYAFRLRELRVHVRPYAFRLGGDVYKCRYSACVNGCGEIKPVGLVLLIAQGCRRKEATLGKVAGREPMPLALYFFKSIFVCGNHSRIIHSPHVVMMCDEKKYNPQGGSLLACTVTQGRQRCTCQPCAIESITPMG